MPYHYDSEDTDFLSKLQHHFKEHKEAYCSAALILLPFVGPFLLAELFSLAYDAFHLGPILRFLATFVLLFFLDGIIVFVSFVILRSVYECFFPKKLDFHEEDRLIGAWLIYGTIGVYFCLCVIFSDRIQEDWHRMVAQYASDTCAAPVQAEPAPAEELRAEVPPSPPRAASGPAVLPSSDLSSRLKMPPPPELPLIDCAPLDDIVVGPRKVPASPWERVLRDGNSRPYVAPRYGRSDSLHGDETDEDAAEEYWITEDDDETHNDSCSRYGEGDGYYSREGSGEDCDECGGMTD